MTYFQIDLLEAIALPDVCLAGSPLISKISLLHTLLKGVPQGSFFGPASSTIYTAPLCTSTMYIVHSNSTSSTTLFLSLPPNCVIVYNHFETGFH